MARIFKRIFLSILVCFVLSVLGFLFWVSDKNVVPIIMYHHVTSNTPNPELNTVSPENFDRQMAYLKNHNYNVISLSDLVDAYIKSQKLPARSVAITFDDGYEDNYTYAYPILKKYNLPATIFLVSDFIDQGEFLKIVQIKEMQASGLIQYGSHTKSHFYLPAALEDSKLRSQIAESKNVLEEKLKQRIDLFCYPVGGFTERVKEILKESGYKAAVTTNRGYDRLNKDLFELKRVRLNNNDTERSLWAKLSGYYNLFRKSVNPGEQNYQYE